MGIYDQGKVKLNFGFRFSFRQFKYPILGLGVVIVALVCLLALAVILQPKPIVAELEPNPLELAKGQTNTFLTVTINNVSDATAKDVVVSVHAVAAESLVVFPQSRVIDTLGKGEYRTLNPFSIRPNPNSTVYSGSYDLVITTAINGKQFSETVTLELKAV